MKKCFFFLAALQLLMSVAAAQVRVQNLVTENLVNPIGQCRKGIGMERARILANGLIKPGDWQALWIMPGFEEDSLRASLLFRKEFSSSKKIVLATAYIAAHGLYTAKLNGEKIGNTYFTPGWTSYNKRLQYQAYDVTNLIKQGNNAIAVTLGSGWYRGNLAWGGNKDTYGKDIALLLQIDIVYADGTTARIVSDESWKSSTGAILYSEIYHGETVDARREKKGWAMPGFNDAGWSSVKRGDFSKEVLLATYNEKKLVAVFRSLPYEWPKLRDDKKR